MTEPAECLDDETLVSFVRGVVDPAELALIDEHLDQCESCFEIAAGLSGRLSRLPAPGDRVGRYAVLEVLGQGAMGMVVAAYDRELDRRVALKLLPSANDDASRWLEEARALARVTHPNVVGVFEVGQAEGHVYIAMELVTGTTLRAWLAVPREWKEIRKVFVDAARGLGAAHERGVVHRDFKPDNVMISREGQAKVTDFGLARVSVDAELAPAVNDAASPILRTKAAAGTPAYMAPELFDRQSASPASDQFAFAVSCWEALFGERPFLGDDLASLAASVRRGVLVEPKGTHRVPGFVVAALRRALDRDPEARFESMSALAHELTRDERTNHRRRSWVAVGVAVLVSGGVVVATAQRDRAPSCDAGRDRLAARWNSAARAQITQAGGAHSDASERLIGAIDRWGEGWATAHDTACARTARGEQSDAMLDLQVACLNRALLSVEPLVSKASADGGRGIEPALDRIDEVLPDLATCATLDPAGAKLLPEGSGLHASVDAITSRLAATRASLAIEGPKLAAQDLAALIEDATTAEHAPLMGEVHLLAADVARGLGDFDGARRHLGDALLAFGKANDRRGDASTWLRFLSLHGSQGLYGEAEHSSKLVYSMLLGLGNPPELELEYRETMGAVFTATGRLEQAEDELARALTLEQSFQVEPSRAQSRILTNLGNLARAQGDLNLALERHRLAKSLDEERLGPANVNVPRHLHNIAGVLKMMGQREDALAAYRESLAKREAITGRDSPDCAITHNSLGIFLAEDGDLDLGRKHLLEAKRIFALTAHAHEAIARENLEWLARLEEHGEPEPTEPTETRRVERQPRPAHETRAPTREPDPVASVTPVTSSPAPPTLPPPPPQPSRINTPNGSGAYVPSPAWP